MVCNGLERDCYFPLFGGDRGFEPVWVQDSLRWLDMCVCLMWVSKRNTLMEHIFFFLLFCYILSSE